MTILLLGANGQLGRSFLQDGGLARRGELVAASRDGMLVDGSRGDPVDLADSASVAALLDRVQPDIIVNAAAYTAVDRAEQEEALATRINGDAVGELGAWAAAHGALVVHYSTDYVFDGRSSVPYPVDHPPAPLGAYGRSKLLGEQALRASGAAHLILRTAWVYAAHGQNFLRTMLRLAGEREELRVVADQHGSPTSTDLIVNGTLAALDRWQQADAPRRAQMTGTYHLVSSGSTSWHGFASAIIDQAHAIGLLARRPRVVPITTADFPTPARRPACSVLDSTAFRHQFSFVPPNWRDGLDGVIDQLARGGRV